MGICQENLAAKPMPEVHETEHGAVYVTAATETPVEAAVEKVEPAPARSSAEKVAEKTAEKSVKNAEKKKGGRPKKSNKVKK